MSLGVQSGQADECGLPHFRTALFELESESEKGHPLMGTPFTPGQLNRLQSIINIGVTTILHQVAKKYDPKIVLKALDGRGKIFAGHLEAALDQAINSMLMLTSRGTVTVTLPERHDPDAFYRTRSGLYIWDDFRTRITAQAKPSETGATFKVESFGLMRGLDDKEIEAMLPKSHLFDETQVSAIIAGLIARQPNGEDGALVNNNFANLFYTSSRVVGVGWRAGGRQWVVASWERGDDRWVASSQVFSPAN